MENVSETSPKRIGTGLAGPGRPKGSIPKHTKAAAEFAEAALARHPDLVDQFLASDDERIRFDCWKLLAEYQWGKPVQRLALDLEAEARKWADSLGVDPKEFLEQSRAVVDGAMN